MNHVYVSNKIFKNLIDTFWFVLVMQPPCERVWDVYEVERINDLLPG